MPRLFATTLSASIVLGLAGAALGQNALGDGTALDANLQVGSGRRNTPARSFYDTLRFNEAVVTGTAGRGAAFHGNIGYRPSDEFGGRVPSNDLYTFRRDSAQSALPAVGVRGSDALRYQFSAATGQAVPPSLAGGVGIVPRSYASVPSTEVSRSTVTSSLRSTADYLAAQSVRPTLVGYRTDDSGSVYTATASPLLGVTWFPLQPTTPLSADLSSTTTPGSTAQPGAAGPRTGIPRPLGLTGLESTASGLPSPLDFTLKSAPGALGEQRSPANDARIRSESYSRVLDAYRQSFTRRTDAQGPTDPISADEPEAPWNRELDQLRGTLRDGRRPAQDGRAPTTPQARPETPDRDAAPSGPRMPGVDAESLINPPKKPGPKPEDFISPRMVDILKNAGVRIDTLRPLTPKVDQAAYASHMQAGQQAIAEGRFFDAEDRFSRAMSAMPRDPMAAVGRVHAQLGAGLYLSAASNLRQLLADHPELVAAKYNETLVPDADRSKKIAEQLRIEVTTGGTQLSRDAAMLLGYLGRLRSDPAMQQEGLAAWRNRIPLDDEPELALHELLSKVWTDR